MIRLLLRTSLKSKTSFQCLNFPEFQKRALASSPLFISPQGKNASAVSAADISSLGPLVCELEPTWISSLKPDALNFTLQALASCKHIPQPSRGPLFTLLTNFYG